MPEKRTLYLCLNIYRKMYAEGPIGNKKKIKMLPGAFGIMTVYETLELLREHEGEDARYEVLEHVPRAEDDNA